jgi:hypothetical protein
VVSAAVTGKFKENAKPSLLIARCGQEGIVHKLLINLRSPQLLFYFVKWSRKDSSISAAQESWLNIWFHDSQYIHTLPDLTVSPTEPYLKAK